jgi:hypothetical protein
VQPDPKWSRRKRVAVGAVTIGVAFAILVGSMAALAAIHDQPVKLEPNGYSQIGILQCYAIQFYLSSPGTIWTNWTSDRPVTTFVFSEAQFHSPGLGGDTCTGGDWGTPVWQGTPNATSGSVSAHLESGTYFLVFSASSSPTNVLGQPLIFTPEPFHWY